MANLAFILFGILICFSCSKEKPENSKWFEAEWIYVTDTAKFQFDPRYVGFKFKHDSLISISNLWSTNEGHYSICNDTIKVGEKDDFTGYKIIRITLDSLTILLGDDTLKYYNRKLEYSTKLKYQKIKLVTGECFGKCPEFTFTLNQNGSAEFEGIQNTKKIGSMNFLMEIRDKEKIDSLFKWTNIARTDTTDFYGSVDDWAISLVFEVENVGERKINGTLSSMPFRLKGIIWILLRDLKKRALI